MRILMVCLGNICRSPLAEGILREKSTSRALSLYIDSAGTSSNHVGEMPDSRSIDIAKAHNIDIKTQRSRAFKQEDFQQFDFILVMDQSNYRNILEKTTSLKEKAKVKMILNYSEPELNKEVPDPYYGGAEGFETVYQMLDKAIDAFLIKECSSYA